MAQVKARTAVIQVELVAQGKGGKVLNFYKDTEKWFDVGNVDR